VTGSPSRCAAVTAAQPSGPSVATCTSSVSACNQRCCKVVAKLRPKRKSGYIGIGHPKVHTAFDKSAQSSAAWRGRTRQTSWPRPRKYLTVRAAVKDTPFSSGG